MAHAPDRACCLFLYSLQAKIFTSLNDIYICKYMCKNIYMWKLYEIQILVSIKVDERLIDLLFNHLFCGAIMWYAMLCIEVKGIKSLGEMNVDLLWWFPTWNNPLCYTSFVEVSLFTHFTVFFYFDWGER